MRHDLELSRGDFAAWGAYVISVADVCSDKGSAAFTAVCPGQSIVALRDRLANVDRSPIPDLPARLTARGLKMVLDARANEAVSPADWPIDYIDTDTRRYLTAYLWTRRHLGYLVCRYLGGFPVPPDVRAMMATLGVSSYLHRLSEAIQLCLTLRVAWLAEPEQ